MGEKPLDLLWPPDARGSFKIGSRLYDLRKISDFQIDYITAQSQTRWFEYGQMSTWKPGPYGACFAEKVFSGIWFYRNDGEKIILPSTVWETGKKTKNLSVVDIFWCENGHIGRILTNGHVIISTTSGEKIKRIPCPDDSGVVLSTTFMGGAAFVTQASTFWVFDALSWTFTPMAQNKIPADPSAIGFNNGKGFVAVKQKLYHVDYDNVNLIETLPMEYPSQVIVSPKGDLVAVVAEKELFVLSSSHLKFPKVSAQQNITSVAFLDDSTVCYVSGTKLEILTTGSQVRPFDGETYLVAQDPDSVRILQNGAGYLLTPVHDSIQKLFRSPMIERLTKLVEAKTKYDAQDPDSYNVITSLGIHLEQLVVSILDALPNVTDVAVVRKMYELAAFAKYFVARFKHDIALQYKNDLDIANELRSHRYKWFLTGPVFSADRENKTNIVSVLSQLQCRNLAAVICRLYNINMSMVAESWAIDMIEQYPRDKAKDCLDLIVKKVACHDQVDFIRLAKRARKKNWDVETEQGLVKLERDAKKRMIYFEKRTPGGGGEAVRQNVVDSLDGNAILTYLFLNKMRRDAKFGAWLGETIKKPFLIDQYIGYKKYVRGNPSGIQRIRDLPIMSRETRINIEISYGWSPGYGIGQDATFCRKLRNDFFKSDKNSPIGHELERQEKLISYYSELYAMSKDDISMLQYPAKSPRFLMEEALKRDNKRVFERIVDLYKVPRRVKLLVQLRTFLKLGKFLDAEKVAGQSMSPPEYEEMAYECLNFNRRKEAVAFIDRLKPDKKFELLEKLEFWEEALERAKNMGDGQRVTRYKMALGLA